MKHAVRWMLILVTISALISGCASSAKQEPSPNESAAQKPPESTAPPAAAPQPRQKPDPTAKITEITQKEFDQAEAVVVLYFDAVVNQDKALVDFLWFGNPAPTTKPVPSGTRTAIMEEIKALKGEIRDDLPTVYFEVKVNLGENPGGTWNPGTNHRWVQVVKTKDGWKIQAVPTSPPAL